jgi:obg-like ATPase 1
MPPKKGKKAEPTERPHLGRFKNNLKMGLVGLPNVGKSSLFNLLCKMQVLAANYPFATIEPTEARAIVPDDRYNKLCEIYKPKSEVPAFFTVTDIAGLVKGAADGAGLGNAFLSNISAVDGIFNVVRAFEDEEVSHVDGEVDPVRDMATIAEELRAKDLQNVVTALSKFRQGSISSNKEVAAQHEFLTKVKAVLEEDKNVRHVDWTGKEVEALRPLNLLTAKPVIYLVNLSETDYIRQKNKHLKRIKEWIDANSPGDPILPVSIAFEQDVVDGNVDEEKAKKSAIGKIIVSGYRHLHLISFFTCGADEVRQWTIRDGFTAPEAAGTIHNDFRENFIQAEVLPYADWEANKCSESEAKSNGKLKMCGKTYIVADGDICHFKIGQSGAGKKK